MLVCMELKVKRLKPAQFKYFADHLTKHMKESGKNGVPIFDPNAQHHNFYDKNYKKRVTARWRRKITDPDWEVMWGVWDGKDMIAHVALRGGSHLSRLHRAALGIGVQQKYHGRGLGRLLMETVIGFAKEHDLAWIDLHVLTNNKPAIALYRKFKFKKIGGHQDAFRLGRQKIHDLQMTLKL